MNYRETRRGRSLVHLGRLLQDEKSSAQIDSMYCPILRRWGTNLPAAPSRCRSSGLCLWRHSRWPVPTGRHARVEDASDSIPAGCDAGERPRVGLPLEHFGAER